MCGFSLITLQKERLASFLNGCFFFDYTSNGLVGFINSVYVTKEHRKKGLFNKMFDKLIEKALNMEAKFVRLYVDIDNYSAKKVYQAIGMRQTNDELFNIDILSCSTNDVEFRSVYYELLDECEFTLEPATKPEIEDMKFESMHPILYSDKNISKTKAGILNALSSTFPTEIRLLKQDGKTVGIVGGYYFHCDWTDCRIYCVNDIRVEESLLENAQELTALMIQFLLEQDDYPNRYFTVLVKDAKEWVKPMLRTCGATFGHYDIFEKVL